MASTIQAAMMSPSVQPGPTAADPDHDLASENSAALLGRALPVRQPSTSQGR